MCNNTEKVEQKWHKLIVGDIIHVKKTKDSDVIVAKVLSFRKIMAIVLCDTGQYELFEPGEFNGFYFTKVINMEG